MQRFSATDAILLPEPDVIPSDLDLAEQILLVLRKHYPGYEWSLDIPPNQNAVIVRNYDLDRRGNMGIFFKKETLWAGDLTKKIVRAGGEFLERYGQLRGGRHEDFDWRDLLFKKPEA